jgi:hypothetical protein
MKYHNELEQSWRKLKQDHPEVAKAIEESANIENLFSDGAWVVIHDPSWSDNEIYRAPMQTEADKFSAKWGGKKICQEGMGRHAYHLVMGVLDHNRVYMTDQDGKFGHIVLRVSDDWQLWESPKVKLDTRRVAGWWCTYGDKSVSRLVDGFRMDGTHIFLGNVSKHKFDNIVFSKDPMKPLDQWQTLEEICGGEA